MKLVVRECHIIRPTAEHGGIVGLAQVRKLDPSGRRIEREGCAILLLQGGGREVHVLLTPDESRELGAQLVAVATYAGDAAPPIFQMPPDDGKKLATQ